MNVLAVLLDFGLDAVGHRGWVGNVRPGSFTPVACMVHHTASGDSDGIVDLCYRGRVDLPGPLCNVVVRKSGRLHVVSNGRANDSGMGSSVVLSDVRKDKSPPGTAKQRGLADDTNGNPWFYDFEVVNVGDGNDPYPVHQQAALVGALAAVCQAKGWGAARIVGHAEWSARKIDPRGLDMNHLRDAVASRLTQGDDMTPEQDQLLRDVNNRTITLADEVAKLRAGGATVDLDALANKVADKLAERLKG